MSTNIVRKNILVEMSKDRRAYPETVSGTIFNFIFRIVLERVFFEVRNRLLAPIANTDMNCRNSQNIKIIYWKWNMWIYLWKIFVQMTKKLMNIFHSVVPFPIPRLNFSLHECTDSIEIMYRLFSHQTKNGILLFWSKKNVHRNSTGDVAVYGSSTIYRMKFHCLHLLLWPHSTSPI